ncbi:hypothetical protein PRZ48_009323 [Zasmidium cellare]|uniref:Heterokaryon incompatibility domain-containing protein n=1 Tax=Zasmidium cellare TaxID=395010 RepID=A0ABR0EC74_ZASCE|nr:hypothetical protein PRZ48_009323 [Zasmidium cellare]
MRLLRNDTLELQNFTDESKIPRYAILSHTWLRPEAGEEVLFADMDDIPTAQTKKGWSKLEFACRQAAKDGLNYVWIDTCCIDKSSSAELSESINSMYRWYSNSHVCYIHLDNPLDSSNGETAAEETSNVAACATALHVATESCGSSAIHTVIDVSGHVVDSRRTESSQNGQRSLISGQFDSTGGVSIEEPGDSTVPHGRVKPNLSINDIAELVQCRWFTRGWTLQEMIASPRAVFYDQSGRKVGLLKDLADFVADITGVHADLLRGNRPLDSFSISQKMHWASNRVTTRIEDQAYSLLVIFDVSLAVIYGEGERAFQRLQEELLRVYSDHTIFAWGYEVQPGSGNSEQKPSRRAPPDPSDLLAKSPADFSDVACRALTSSRRGERQREYEVSGRCIKFTLPVFGAPANGELENKREWAAVLNCCFENRPTKYVVINLLRSTSGDFTRLSLQQCEVYDAHFRCNLCELTVMRTPVKAKARPGGFHAHVDDFERLFVRLRHFDPVMGDPELRIVEAQGYIVTNPKRQDLEPRRLSEDLWDSETACFIVPRQPNENFPHVSRSSKMPYLLEAKITLGVDKIVRPVTATVTIHPEPLFDQSGAVQGCGFVGTYRTSVQYDRLSRLSGPQQQRAMRDSGISSESEADY